MDFIYSLGMQQCKTKCYNQKCVTLGLKNHTTTSHFWLHFFCKEHMCSYNKVQGELIVFLCQTIDSLASAYDFPFFTSSKNLTSWTISSSSSSGSSSVSPDLSGLSFDSSSFCFFAGEGPCRASIAACSGPDSVLTSLGDEGAFCFFAGEGLCRASVAASCLEISRIKRCGPDSVLTSLGDEGGDLPSLALIISGVVGDLEQWRSFSKDVSYSLFSYT